MVWSWLQRHPRTVRTVLVLASLASALGYATRHHDRALGIALALVQCLPIALLWRRPLRVLAVVTAATIAIVVGWGFYDPLPIGIVLFVIANRLERRESIRAAAIAIAALAVPVLHSVGWTHPLSFLGRLIGFAIAWLI